MSGPSEAELCCLHCQQVGPQPSLGAEVRSTQGMALEEEIGPGRLLDL